MARPVIGIPCGDPAGIGPEIVVKALRNKELYRICKPLVVGDVHTLKKTNEIIRSGSCILILSIHRTRANTNRE